MQRGRTWRTFRIYSSKKVCCYSSLASLVEQDEGTFDISDYCCCAYHNKHTNYDTQIEQRSHTLLEYIDLALHDIAILFGIDSSQIQT